MGGYCVTEVAYLLPDVFGFGVADPVISTKPMIVSQRTIWIC